MQAELRKRNLRTVVLILNWLSAKSTHAKERNNSGLGDALKWTITAVFVIAIAQCITALVELFLYNYLSLEIIAWTVGAFTVIPVLVILFVNWKSSKWLENDWGKTHATFSSLREMLKSRLMVCRANSNEKAG